MFALNPVLTLVVIVLVLGILIIAVIRVDRANKAALAAIEEKERQNKNVPVQGETRISGPVAAVSNDVAVVAAIIAAINEYRKTNT
jgi:Na+-transporting methylmalonyl-CoA/oxaloacetate decarboxylase gamma subunit